MLNNEGEFMNGKKLKWVIFSLLILIFSMPAFSESCKGVTVNFTNETAATITITQVSTKRVGNRSRYRWFKQRDFSLMPGETSTIVDKVHGTPCDIAAYFKVWITSDAFNRTKERSAQPVIINDSENINCRISGTSYSLSCVNE